MGTNALSNNNQGESADAADVNQFREAFLGDIVPRNTAGIVADLAGSIGSSARRWVNGFFQKLVIGAISSGLIIEESSGSMVLKVGDNEILSIESDQVVFKQAGSPVVTIDSTGIDSPGINPDSLNLGYAKSGTVDTSVTGNSGFQNVSGLSVSITTNGGPVICVLASRVTANAADAYQIGAQSNSEIAYVAIARAGTRRGVNLLNGTGQNAKTGNSFTWLDEPAAGTHTYQVQFSAFTGVGVNFLNCRLLCYELPN